MNLQPKTQVTKDLYLSLALLPRGLVFGDKAAAILLYSHKYSQDDLEAAKSVAETLESRPVLTREDNGKYRMHDSHVDFVRKNFPKYLDLRDRALRRWHEYLQTLDALVAWPTDALVEMWREVVVPQVGILVQRPYDTALAGLEISSVKLPFALKNVGDWYFFGDSCGVSCHLTEDLAVEHYSRALQALRGANLGIDHPVAAEIVEGVIGSVHSDNFEVIENILLEVLSIQDETLSPDHSQKAQVFRGLGICAHFLNREEDAEQWHDRADSIEDAIDHGDSLVQAGYDNIYMTGKCTEFAKKQFKRALAIRVDKLGPRHLKVAEPLSALGHCVVDFGRVKEADGWYQRALGIIENQLVPVANDLHFAQTLYRVAWCAFNLGRTIEAKVVLERVLAIKLNLLSTDDIKVANVLHLLGRCAT